MILAIAALALAFATPRLHAQSARRAPTTWRGVNLIETPAVPYGSAECLRALDSVRALGANAVALVPFLWQRSEHDPVVVRSDSARDAALALTIRAAHARGMRVLLKPHVWVPERWAGAIVMQGEADWARWFATYERGIVAYARLAHRERVERFAVGTELRLTTHRPEWRGLLAAVRGVEPGRLTYVAHGLEELEQLPFRDALDDLALTYWPALGEDARVDQLRARVADASARLIAAARRLGRPVLVAEVGLRSARGASQRPWESAEERQAQVDEGEQAVVFDAWLSGLSGDAVSGVLIWRWFTDGTLGGPSDTDFTPQRKLAARVLRSHWGVHARRPIP